MTLLERIRSHLDSFGQASAQGHVAQASEQIRTLFCKELNWAAPRGFPRRRLVLGRPVDRQVEAVPVAQMSGLPVYYISWPGKKLPGVTARRTVQKALSPTSAEHLICYAVSGQPVPSSVEGQPRPLVPVMAFTWARQRPDGKIELRTLPYEVGSPARTTLERLAELAFHHDELFQGEPPIPRVLDKLNHAFDVEAVTEKFFEGFQKLFDDLQRLLLNQHPDPSWAHDYALQMLSRLLFLYFIQRKGWLGGDLQFLLTFWKAYQQSSQQKDTFFTHWLCVLFFEAFNKRLSGKHPQFPDPIGKALREAPYLNGGLFTRNLLDDKYSPCLPDAFFKELFDEFEGSTPGFFERYNFTISESTPLDIEVAVDPEMIGKVYESLVNISTEGITPQDRRGRAGIFYTPRIEIDLMCRLALVDALANRLGASYRPLLYDWVFAHDWEEKQQIDQQIAEHNLWPTLHEHLCKITVCDPACGSGSFLVGMLLVLDDLNARANLQLGIEETPYRRRRRIIGEQLYGVDVMHWAVHIAELRLWLQLVVETELLPGELQLQPLLPNLSFKIRQGDSLLQEIADIHLGLRRYPLDMPTALAGKLTQLKSSKLRFYQGDPKVTEQALRHEELRLFRQILQEKIHHLQNQIASLNRQILALEASAELPGVAPEDHPRSPTRQELTLRSQREEKQADLDRFRQALQALDRTQDIPFVWDIAFVEIFEGPARGFDIVLGNPPYVRQEMIAPPLLDPACFGSENSPRWKAEKQKYKQKLQLAVAAAWPNFFRYSHGTGTFRKLDGKSDLYVYFYFHGLCLLNPMGTFCFITSNSWLDVGYGADLQEFLLRHSHVKLVLDNEAKRSFAQADVNTVIVLLAPADDRKPWGLEQTARFVMFKKPFEELARAEVFKAIEAVPDRLSTPDYRVTARPQRELLEEGLETDADDVGATPRGCPPTPRGRAQSGKAQEPAPTGKSHGPLIKTARYIGNKWGGKYLRAPDIFFTILEKGKGKLVRLGEIAEVRFGIKTGANEFFYLEPTGNPAPAGYLHVRNGAGWEGEIEEEFLKPFLFSLREVERYEVDPLHLERKVLVCSWSKEELQRQKKKGVLSYIEYGEKQGFDRRPSVRGRRFWYAVPEQECPDFVSNRFLGERLGFPFVRDSLVCDVFFVGTFNRTDGLTGTALLNSIVSLLAAEVTSRKTYGIGVAYLYGPEIRALSILRPDLLNGQDRQYLHEAFSSMRKRAILKIADEIHQPDRRALDEVVFDVLGLTAGEREAVYEAVVNLVRARLEKARSV